MRKLDSDQNSPLRNFENETLVMALGLLGALVANPEQVFRLTADVTGAISRWSYVSAQILLFDV